MNAAAPAKLNVGCGRDVREGWVNVDVAPGPGIDIVCDLAAVRASPIPLPDASVDTFLLSHVLEHLADPLALMQDLYRLALPDAVAVVQVPHGGSDDAWEDPTHVRAFFVGSFGFFSQPWYWRADYGYGADWQPERVLLHMDRGRCEGLAPAEAFEKARRERNVVREMVCELRAVKPARERRRELASHPRIDISLVD